MNFQFNKRRLLLLVYLHIPSLLAQSGAREPGPNGTFADRVNALIANKLELYRGSLPEELQSLATTEAIAQHLGPTLQFLYTDTYNVVKAHGFAAPELGPLFEPDGPLLFGNLSYANRHRAEIPFETTLQFLKTTLKYFDPTRLSSILTAYPICRRAVMAVILERYLTVGRFSETEAKLVADVSELLFMLHHRAAQTKRIIEFFHVSKSGGTSFCQLGKMNGCKTQSFDTQQNCMITYFRDSPRWTRAGVLGDLSATKGDPWCARYGRQYGMRWHCRARRQLMTRMRFNFYSNELVMHDHNRSWVGVHPCREFLNVVIFREPHSRVLSHMQNILKEYVAYYNESLWTAFDPNSAAQWRTLAVPVFDNYVVRSLLGGKAYNMPYGQMNETHLLAAKIVTLQFEVLVSLSPATSELTRDIFGQGLGWQYDLRHMHVRPTEKRQVPSFGSEVMEAVSAAGRLDEQLYDFALVLQLLDALTFGVAHDVVGVDGVVRAGAGAGAGGSGGDGDGDGGGGGGAAAAAADEDDEMEPAATGSGGLKGLLGSSKRSRGRGQGCGYVGVRRPPADAMQFQKVPPVIGELGPYNLTETERVFAVEGLGAVVIDGGRWFKGEFYRNSSDALDAAAAAGRAVEAAAVARLAELAAEAADAAVQASRTDGTVQVKAEAASRLVWAQEKAAMYALEAARLAAEGKVGGGPLSPPPPLSPRPLRRRYRARLKQRIQRRDALSMQP